MSSMLNLIYNKEQSIKPDEDEDWMKYANAGFGETDYSLWDDEEVTEAPIETDSDWMMQANHPTN